MNIGLGTLLPIIGILAGVPEERKVAALDLYYLQV